MNILFIIKILLIVVAIVAAVFAQPVVIPILCLSIAMLIDVIQEKA